MNIRGQPHTHVILRFCDSSLSKFVSYVEVLFLCYANMSGSQRVYSTFTLNQSNYVWSAGGGAVGRGTALQAGRSRV